MATSEQQITIEDFKTEARALDGTRELLFLLAAVVEEQEARIRALEHAREREEGE